MRAVQAQVHDESAFALRPKIIAGSAGLFSTVPDLLNFMEMLSGRGTYNGREFFSPQIVEMMQTNFSDISGVTMGLGWELNQPRYMGDHCTPRTDRQDGFYRVRLFV